MTLAHYDPLENAIDGFPRSIRLFQDTVNRMLSEPPRTWAPAVDISESADAVVLTADLPGVNPEDVDLRLEDGTVTIKGDRKFEQETGENGYHRLERYRGSFARSFSLPDSVDTAKVNAEFRNGVLTVTLPKKEAAKPRSVKIGVSKS